MTTDHETLRELAQQLRVDAVRLAGWAGSGHPTSSMSAAELMAALLANHLRYDFADPDRADNDRLLFSKGHASPLLYAVFRAAGVLGEDELRTYRRLGSRLEGHPTPVLPWVDVATGSLGQGLPIGVGMALCAKRFDRLDYRVWVLCGDSELAEGSIWEAVEHAGVWGLDNLVALVDVNRLGQTGETMHGWDLDAYRRRFEAFDWRVLEVDGLDVAAVDGALGEATSGTGRPTVLLARTVKGMGVADVADREGAHGKALADAEAAVAELGGERDIRVGVAAPATNGKAHLFRTGEAEPARYEVGAEVATRQAYGEALAALGAVRGDVLALDAEVSNSTKSEVFAEAHPDRYVEHWISEQQMISTAVALQSRGWVPYASTFAAFLTRAYDFVRMGAVSRADLRLCGSHAGVAIGEDGPSQMGLEDLAMMRAVHGSTVLYPCDANQTARLVEAMADCRGVTYLRTNRGATPVIYAPDDEFRVGGSRVVRASQADDVTLIGAGVTLHEALAAADVLAGEGVAARVVDLYSVKPIDVDTLLAAARDTGLLVTVEDHWPEGGLGDAVLDALAAADVSCRVTKLAVRAMPGSATEAEQLVAAGIDRGAIAEAVRRLVDRTPG